MQNMAQKNMKYCAKNIKYGTYKDETKCRKIYNIVQKKYVMTWRKKIKYSAERNIKYST